MKKINENTKVTLTLEQLKRLVKETTEEPTEEDIFDYIKTMGSKVGGDDLIRDLQDTFGLSSTEAMTYVERYTHDDRRRFEHLDESTKHELEVISVEQLGSYKSKYGTKNQYIIRFALDGNDEDREEEYYASSEEAAIDKLLRNYNAVRTDVPLFEDDGDDEEPVLWWEVVNKETGARFASGTVPENEKAEKFKSVLEFLYGDDVEVRIKRIF